MLSDRRQETVGFAAIAASLVLRQNANIWPHSSALVLEVDVTYVPVDWPISSPNYVLQGIG
jgi:hypothetical protein